jgi:hypothetical protein
MHKFDKSALSTDALYNFRTSLSVVVSFLETPKIDHDEKAALYLNAILKFNLIIALLVAEHILSSTCEIGTLQNNSLCFFDVRLHRVYLFQFQILKLFRMLYKLTKAPRT